MNEHYPFELPPLSYGYYDLEPHLDGDMIKTHHTVIMQNYVDRLNSLLARFPQYQDWSLKALVAYADTFPPALRKELKNSAGGLYNHYVYFNSVTPGGRMPTQRLMNQIKNTFGNFENMKKALYNSALINFGCGYTWLVCNKSCNLQIINTQRNNTPPLTVVSPVAVIDMWEHSFFQQYVNGRDDYINAWLEVADWSKICEYMACSTALDTLQDNAPRNMQGNIQGNIQNNTRINQQGNIQGRQ